MNGFGRRKKPDDAMLGVFGEASNSESDLENPEHSGFGFASMSKSLTPKHNAKEKSFNMGDSSDEEYSSNDQEQVYLGSDEDDEDFNATIRGIGQNRSRKRLTKRNSAEYDISFATSGDVNRRRRRKDSTLPTGPVTFVPSSTKATTERLAGRDPLDSIGEDNVSEQSSTSGCKAEQTQQQFSDLLNRSRGRPQRCDEIKIRPRTDHSEHKELARTANILDHTPTILPVSTSDLRRTPIPSKPAKPTEPLPAIGEWQKHTTGIGLKYLQKFGFKGRLGKDESGIAAPVDAMAHDGTRGLGFGVKSSRPAMEKGTSLDDSSPYIGEKVRKHTKQQASWKKKEQKLGEAERADMPRTIDEVLLQLRDPSIEAKRAVKVIDMRGSEATELSPDGDSSAAPLLGQELLYNLSVGYAELEASIYAESRQLAALEVRIANSKQEAASVHKMQTRDAPRLGRLRSLSEALMQIQQKVQTDEAAVTLPAAIDATTMLFESFPEEMVLFGLVQLATTLSSAAMRAMSARWEPLLDPLFLQTVAAAWSPLVGALDQKAAIALASDVRVQLRKLLQHYCLPKIRQSLLVDWNVLHPATALLLVEEVRRMLGDAAAAEIIGECVWPRLAAAAEAWTPATAESAPIHVWLLPWQSVLSERLTELYPDVRRKLANALQIALSHPASSKPATKEDISLLRQSIEPWLVVFGPATSERLVARPLLPFLITTARHAVSVCTHGKLCDTQEAVPALLLEAVSVTTSWQGMLPTVHLRALLLGERLHSACLTCFARWLDSHPLTAGTPQSRATLIRNAVDAYRNLRQAYGERWLQEDPASRQALSVALQMISEWHASSSSLNSPALNHLMQSPLAMPRVCALNFTYFAAMQFLRPDSGSPHIAVQATGKQPHRVPLPSFREVVEQIAANRGWSLVPLSMWEGHQLFRLGTHVVYMHMGVLFVNSGQSWRPTSLEAL